MTYEECYRDFAARVTDAELRRMGMSSHQLVRVRSLSAAEQGRAIEAFLIRAAMGRLDD